MVRSKATQMAPASEEAAALLATPAVRDDEIYHDAGDDLVARWASLAIIKRRGAFVPSA